MYIHTSPLVEDTTPLRWNCMSTLQEPLTFGVAHAGRRGSSGPAGENTAADLSSVQTLNIRLFYKVSEYV